LINLRAFVKTSAVALPVAYLAAHSPVSYAEGPLAPAGMDPGIPWQRKIRRVAQVNMTEHDPAVMDVEAWADYMARLQVGATFISVFDFVHEDRMQLERLKKYSALILPNTALLSDEQCQQLRDYVQQGGSLLATFESSMYTEQNERRADFGLADVFVIHAAGPVIGRVGDSSPFYARIEKQHPILEGFHHTSILPGSEYRVPSAPVDSPVLTVMPGFPAYPPELSYPPQPHTVEPAVVLRQTDKGCLVFFPGDIERTMWLAGNTDLSRLLQNAIRWVGGCTAPVSIGGRGFIEVFAWETEPGFAVRVLNYTNPNVHQGWVREFYPIGEQQVRMKLPPGRGVDRVELLRAGNDIPFRVRDGSVEFTIPSVEDYEVAALYSSS
jgi:hypothetical protein